MWRLLPGQGVRRGGSLSCEVWACFRLTVGSRRRVGDEVTLWSVPYGSWDVHIPLVIPFLAILLPTLLLWFLDRRRPPARPLPAAATTSPA